MVKAPGLDLHRIRYLSCNIARQIVYMWLFGAAGLRGHLHIHQRLVRLQSSCADGGDILTRRIDAIFSEDMYAQNSIDLLKDCGIQFDRHQGEGITISDFAELLMSSGIVLCDNVKWLSFSR